MNEKVENLILEHLRSLRGSVDALGEEMLGMRGEMRSLKQHMAGLLSHETAQDGDLAAIKLRLDRIEKRLDLVE